MISTLAHKTAVPGTRTRREKTRTLIPPVGDWASGSIQPAPHSPLLAPLLARGGGARGGSVTRRVVDGLVVGVVVASLPPSAALGALSKDPRELLAALGCLLLAWAVLEWRSVRESSRCTP